MIENADIEDFNEWQKAADRRDQRSEVQREAEDAHKEPWMELLCLPASKLRKLAGDHPNDERIQKAWDHVQWNWFVI